MTEEEMILRLIRRDAKALEYLIDEYSPYVVSIISFVLGRYSKAQDVEELASDVFLAIWNHAESLKPGKVRPYIGTTARNRAKSFLRSKKELEMDLDEIVIPTTNTPESDVIRKEQTSLVREAVLNMPEPDREIFLRFYYYLQTTAQIGKAMGMLPGTVRIHLMRGRNVLKRKLLKEDVL